METDTINQMSDLSESNNPSFNFSNVGTHFPLKYTYGPGYTPIEDQVYWEKDDINVNQINYDLEKNTITTSEEEISGSIKPNKNKTKSNIVSRNVNRRRGRYNR